nr:O-fucosyltransferase 7-like [Quercus suber]
MATVEELQPFINHGSQLAALDYIVSVESDVFIPSYSGNMAKAVEGHRRFLGHRKTIVPLRKTIVRLFDKLENATLKERKRISSQIIDAHIKRQGSPRKRKGPISGTRGMDRFRSEESFYTNPKPECLCQRVTPNVNTSHIIR